MGIKQSILRRSLPLFLFAVVLLVLFALFLNLISRLSDLSEAPKDNLSWALSQIEVEAFQLSNVVNIAAQSDIPDTKEIRRRFNNLYSRVSLIRQSGVFETMRQDVKFSKHLTLLEKCLNKLTPTVDASNKDLVENLTKFKKEIAIILPKSHEIALIGLGLNSVESDAERTSISNLLIVTATVSMALVGFLVMISYLLLREYRKSQQASIATERASTRLKSSFETSLDAILVSNSQGVILEFNDAAEAVFGYSKSETIGANMVDLIIPEQYRTAHNEGMARFVKTRKAKLVGKGRIEITALRRSGEEFQIEISTGHAEDENGMIFVSYIRDITERLAAEEELKQARDEALKAEEAKTKFLVVMSHEMRTPLNGLFGTIELLQNTRLTKKQAGYLKLAKSSNEILLHHVNDVLDISKLDAGKLKLSSSAFDLSRFFTEIVATNKATANGQKNALSLGFENMPNKRVHLDEHRLGQVVFNLLSNALKFTKNGTVEIIAKTQLSNNGTLELEFSVSDTGIGISESDVEYIFDEFYTQDHSYDRIASGTGLGLTICKRIIDVMGGEILVSSTLGKGTTFTVRIPIILAEAKREVVAKVVHPVIPDTKLLNGSQILLVEDNGINRTIVRDMLEKDGVIVSEAHNGLEAVDAASKQTFDVILMDVSMPVMNGVDATKQIRKNNGLSSKTPIIGLTAHALEGEQEHFIVAGMNTCLSKPISHNILALEILRILSRGRNYKDNSVTDHGQNDVNLDVFLEVQEILPKGKFDKIIRSFEAEMDALLVSIPELLENADFDMLSKTVHKSVGSSGILGATQLMENLRALEQASKDKNAELCTKTAMKLEQCWASTWKKLQSAII